ncbi:aspartate/glutamate racemase family protein [Dinoroseobacter sp. S76]|uniref:aspartate/glutamate racemase family protein n=1 Tax=Dinoroseobacter sp. S76 TaxID=3415124 RepID=UPI003C7C7314
MAITIINPNSTASMTEAMVRTARQAAPELAFEGWTSAKGPPAIQGEADGAIATPPLLELVDEASNAGAEGIIIGCFDDTGLAQAAARANCPVIGIGQAAYHFAALQQWRFSVVTTLAVSIPVLEGNIATLGLGQHLARVRASEVPVLALEADPEASGQAIMAEAITAATKDEIDALILGCAGMVHVVAEVTGALDIEVIDPVACAARSFSWLI